MYLYIGMPPFNAPFPKIREANTTGYKPFPMIEIIAFNNIGVYW